ncbi:uncharacterized protein BDW47DRAFT_110010 [Aspergillus candidus]|uniref:Uncharacterized protein n=1 Tax=Aspergillus candidus TaxID=41067 RepID=A0A2I2F554_ASPCN|nr:hypothetical protein BDW47DRAFT_110010 [Aspergillus candidus]PLB35706.1 hypothetical protein BDW47DRAFT_110010 [Aspergillus candidus]
MISACQEFLTSAGDQGSIPCQGVSFCFAAIFVVFFTSSFLLFSLVTELELIARCQDTLVVDN